jgi:hypothetical protein
MAVSVGMTVTGELLPRPLVPVPGLWSFWADLVIGAVPLGPVDVSAFTCASVLSGFGTGSVTVSLPCGIDEARLRALWSWRLWAFYGGLPIWCGVPTGIADTGSTQVQLTLTELPGYLIKRQFDVSPSKVYTQIEQTVIAADLAGPVGDVGVALVTSAGGGFLRDRTYAYLEDNRAALLTNLAGVLSGPEFRTEYVMPPGGSPQCTLRIAYPRVGSSAAGLAVAIPGDAFAYSAAWDADQLRTHTFAVGQADPAAAPGTPAPVSVVDAPQADLPRLDAADDWTGVTVASTLNERSATASQQQAAPALTLTVTPSEALPPLGTYQVGDDVTVRATTPLLPGGLTVAGRLTQLSIDAAAGTAAWTVNVPSPPPVARETLLGRLDRIDAKLRGVFHGGPLTILP